MLFIALREHLGKAFTASRLVFAKQFSFISADVANHINHQKKVGTEKTVFSACYLFSVRS